MGDVDNDGLDENGIIKSTFPEQLPLIATTIEDKDPASKFNPAEANGAVTSIPRDREIKIRRPGNINRVTNSGNFPGSRLIYFYELAGKPYVAGLENDDYAKFVEQMKDECCTSIASAINTFFKYRANLLTVDAFPGNYANSLWVCYNNHLDESDLEYWAKASEIQSKLMSEWEKNKAAEREKELAESKAKREEEKVLISLGEKVRDHNIIEKNRELEAEVKKLKKQLKDNGGVDE